MNSVDKTARELLAFYRDAGVDTLVGEEPIDHFADAFEPNRTQSVARPGVEEPATAKRRAVDAFGAAAIEKAPPSRSLPPRAQTSDGGAAPGYVAAPPAPEAAVMAARAAARSAESLDALGALLTSFEGCMLRTTATQLVFADGNPKGRVMFVGEAPGRDEDIAGVPFVGRSGKLLDLMMQAVGLDRTQVYIANIVPWRPPGNRTPTPHESAICLPFIHRQIELADPDILVCLGQPSTQTLLGTREGITRTRGRWFKFNTGSREIRALATYHPAFLLRSPLQKRLAWRDFLALKKALAVSRADPDQVESGSA
jgi:uracil-DNA glycosylase